MSEPKTSIPKFASFRPKPSPPVPDTVDKEKHNHKARGKDKPRDGNDKRRRQSQSRERNHMAAIGAIQLRPLSRDEAPNIFVIDRRGDVDNLVYGSIHRYSVPRFHRIGAGGVLGVSSDTKIDRDYVEEKGIVLTNRRDFGATREKYVFSKVERERPRLLRIRRDAVDEDHAILDADYVSLNTGRGRKRKRTAFDGDEGSDSDRYETHHRSIQGKAKPKDQPLDDDLQFATESDTSDSEAGREIKLDSYIRQRTVELNRRVEQAPNDIDAWLALIYHQEFLIRAGDEHRRVTNAEIRSTAEIKIHMYEKALEKTRSLGDRERLLLGLMIEGSKIWDVNVQSDRWEQISKDNIHSLVLWKSYLNFKQSTFSMFQYEELRNIFIKRIKTLSEAISAAGDSGDSLFLQLTYVLLRFTIFIRESGYSELAVAIWQALLEVNFCAPPKTLSEVDKSELFREFWESEVPRIGEDGALGWHHFVGNADASDVPDVLVDEEENTLNSENIFESWAVAERLRSKTSCIPARTMDEVVEDDPFRIILFSDIEDFLIFIPSRPGNLREMLLDAFLVFCRLPPVSASNQETSQSWSNDPFTGEEMLEWNFKWVKHEYLATDPVDGGDADTSDIFKILSSKFLASAESLFGYRLWFRQLGVWKDRYTGNEGPLAYNWVRNALKQLTQSCFQESLTELYLAFEWRNEPDTIKKISKTLLRQHPASLRLYSAYAMIEWSRGNRDAASGVFSAALGMSKSIPESDSKDSILLWKSWIWGCLEDGNKDLSLRYLLSIADASPNPSVEVTPAVLLKTRQHLSSNRDYLLSSADTRHAIIYAECLALLEYLSSTSSAEPQSSAQGDITSALSIFAAFSQTLSDRHLTHITSHELLLQSATRLLYHHARIGPFRPAFLRQHLTHFISLFPQNTIFLSLYAWNESRLRIDNRVRSILISTVLTPENDTLASRLFAIHYEIKHGTIHSVHSTFEHALAAPFAKFSAGLWKLYILYCLETPHFRQQAKEVWFRAIRACPWAKELYVFGFERMSGMVPFSELKGTWRVMGEKELRVHVDLEEKFEDLRELEMERGNE
jgi:hypothetical protein